jgi:Kef-type K+ transport system membrane component KefB
MSAPLDVRSDKAQGRATLVFRLTVLLLCVTASITTWFIVQLKPSSTSAGLWVAALLITPYAAMLVWLMARRRRRQSVEAWCVLAVLMAMAGLYILADAIYIHPDPQSAIAVLVVPVLQLIMFVLGALFIRWRKA